ncbi:MAG: hypothetical protein ACON5L_01775 [Parvibaculales bacterium]
MLPLTLSGCGFEPLYATRSGEHNAAFALDGITIAAPENRETQLVTNALYLGLDSQGPVRYTLRLESSSSASDLAIESDSRVTRANYRQTVTFELSDIETGQTVVQGRSTRAASYNKVASEFANDQAELNARERTSKAIAEDIKMQIMLQLKQGDLNPPETGK